MKRDPLPLLLLGAPILVVGFIAFAIWWAVWAPCDVMGWLPVSQVPARCLGGVFR